MRDDVTAARISFVFSPIFGGRVLIQQQDKLFLGHVMMIDIQTHIRMQKLVKGRGSKGKEFFNEFSMYTKTYRCLLSVVV